MKKFISVLLAFILSLSGAYSGIYAFAAEKTVYFYPELVNSSGHMDSSLDELSKYIDVDILREHLFKGISQCSDEIDFSAFSLPYEAAEHITDYLYYNMPECFNVSATGASSTGYPRKLNVLMIYYQEYADTKEEYAAMYKEFKSAADGLLAGIEHNSSLSDVEKALLLHDRLAIHTQYDYDYAGKFLPHTAYAAFAKGSAVCQGYAMAYMYLLRRAGINNYYCSSEKLTHGWNIVEIDGKRYHVDVTWDDSAVWYPSHKGIEGRVYHDNFLRSTSGIKATGHAADDFDNTPTDTKYDNYFWQSSDSQFVLCENTIYYIDTYKEKLCEMRTKKELLDISSTWQISANSYYGDNFSCLCAGGAELLFSKADGIYKYTPENGNSEKIFSVDRSKNSYISVYGFDYESGNLIIEMNDTLFEETDFLSKKIPYTNVKKSIKGIIVEGLPTKTEYYIGDSPDYSGLCVKAVYTDNSSETVNTGYTVNGFSSSEAGKKKVSVVYKGYSASFTVNIKKPSITVSPETAELYDDKAVSLTVRTEPVGMAVSFSSSDNNVLTVNNGVASGKTKGTATVTATFIYNGKSYSDTCEITVLCTHSNTETHSEIPATADKSGFTEGIFCKTCKIYIRGHKEIPKLSNVFSDSVNAIRKDGDILVNSGLTAKELLSQASYGAVVMDVNGKLIRNGEIFGTGSRLIFADGSSLMIAVLGDVDGNGSISAADARLALRASVGLESLSDIMLRAADTDGNPKISAADARLILRASVGLENNRLWLK